MNTIQEQWDSFLTDVMPNDAPQVQREEMRKAFYCGAIAMFSINYTIGGDDYSEEAAIMVMEGIAVELDSFKEEMQALLKAEQAGSDRR